MEKGTQKISEKRKPEFSKRAFWDVEPNSLDFNKEALYIIIKIIERGKYEDVVGLFKYYGMERIEKELLTADKIPQQTLYFASTLYNIAPEKFACYTKTQ